MELTKNPEISAKNANLIYINDNIPGFTRKKSGKGFKYFDTENKQITDKTIIKRLDSLGIPPAYNDVWISPLEDSHLQATARDSKGRKQYRYHPDWRQFRSQINHLRMVKFGQSLPDIRTKVEKDLNESSMTKSKVLATIVKLMDLTTIRVGNDEYAHENKSYGLTTFREKHVKIVDKTIQFEFKGKSHKNHKIELKNRKLAKIVQQCVDIPGYELFQYYDQDGQRNKIDSSDVNNYLHEISHEDFTAKDFRTWWGTVLAFMSLSNCEVCDQKTQMKKNVLQTLKDVSKKLGNTPAVCRKYYIFPGLLDSYLEGKFSSIISELDLDEDPTTLSQEEYKTLKFLEARTKDLNF